MKTKNVTTYEKLINQGINRLVVIITLSISLLILAFVGVQQTMMTTRDAQGLMMSLNRSNIESIPNFIEWNNANERHTKQNSFIRVKTQDKSVTAASLKRQSVIMTSPSSKRFLARKKLHIFFNKNMVYIPGYGLFLYYTQKNNNTTYQLWVSLNNLLRSLLLLLIVIAFVVFVTLGFGTWWARRLAKSLSAPTLELVNETKKTTQDLETNQPSLTVPDSPLEINELGNSFNDLLNVQNQRLEREKQFVSDSSHELRTPIAAIRGNISLIKRRGDKHPEVIPESLDFIDEESLRMQKLIENLLHLSRADKADVELSEVNLSETIKQLSDHYQASIPQNINVSIEPDLVINGNLDLIQQITIALLDNASKYSPKNGHIDVNVSKDNDNINLSIADNGMGIPDDKKDKIFQRFYRVDESHSTQIKGSGLGLAIVAKLVILNNAQIIVSDNKPNGSIFTVTFKKA
ncbi:HAMP domain-containing histidine kinase [Companilactobacillus allii]|uniref:histidine kinase n=1 Tax=Companilactobacillus allii TaxID=1847728 RepID=A0A1P8Q1U9_9LACO|nr:HAMP domain-containing sensor histidine kinase [Companilactobacillus allii]APX71840.1 two-component sensor histidine kinase [Companilactobacillus allii]USQ68928.1 HAMP domain-containing histidine kinase [Companilactobacillus allii]